MTAEPITWTTTHGDVVTVWQAAPFVDWRWHVTAANGEIVGQGEGHTREASAIDAAERHHPRVDAAALSDAEALERVRAVRRALHESAESEAESFRAVVDVRTLVASLDRALNGPS